MNKILLVALAILALVGNACAAGTYPFYSVPLQDANGGTGVVPMASATNGGELPFFNDAVTTVQQIKATQGQIYSLYVLNTVAATTYLQLFCKPSASVTLGTTTPDFVYRMMTNAGANSAITISYPTGLCAGGTGLSAAGTTTATGSTGAAVSLSVTYQ